MEDFEDFFWEKMVGIALIGFAAWLFLPRTWHFGDHIMVYSIETSSCNTYNICDVKELWPPLKLRVDQQKAEAVWLDLESGKVGSWTSCTIADKENWTCGSPELKMSGGYLQPLSSNIQHPAGYVYRIYWLLSFLPDGRKK